MINPLKSKTVWAIVALFLINGIGGIHAMIPGGLLPYVDGLVSLLAIYFRINPTQTTIPA